MLLIATIPLNLHSKASASSDNFIIDFRINVSYGLGWRVDTPDPMTIIPGKEYKVNLMAVNDMDSMKLIIEDYNGISFRNRATFFQK